MKRSSGLPQYCSEFFDRQKRSRVRFRRTGYKTHYFQSLPNTTGFAEELAACLDGVAAPVISPGEHSVVPGTFDDLINRFRHTSGFLSAGPTTRAGYVHLLEQFCRKHGRRTVKGMTTDNAEAILGAMSATPTQANNLRKLLKRVMVFAQKLNLRDDDPFRLTDRFKIRSEGHLDWSDAQIAQYEKTHKLGTTARLALALLVHTTQRRGDVVLMGRQHIGADGHLHFRQQKTGTQVIIPVRPELRAAIDACPNNHLTFLATATDLAFSGTYFARLLKGWVAEAGLPDRCTAHGLRKSGLRRLAEARATLPEIMAIGGFKSPAIATYYIRAADQKRLAEAGMARLGNAANG